MSCCGFLERSAIGGQQNYPDAGCESSLDQESFQTLLRRLEIAGFLISDL